MDRTANLPLTARRLAFGKILNAGQTCVAPDYCLVDRTVRDRLVEELKKQFQKMLGRIPWPTGDFVRIINHQALQPPPGPAGGGEPPLRRRPPGRPGLHSGWIAPTLVADTLEGASKPMGRRFSAPSCPSSPTTPWTRPSTLSASRRSLWPSTSSPRAGRPRSAS